MLVQNIRKVLFYSGAIGRKRFQSDSRDHEINEHLVNVYIETGKMPRPETITQIIRPLKSRRRGKFCTLLNIERNLNNNFVISDKSEKTVKNYENTLTQLMKFIYSLSDDRILFEKFIRSTDLQENAESVFNFLSEKNFEIFLRDVDPHLMDFLVFAFICVAFFTNKSIKYINCMTSHIKVLFNSFFRHFFKKQSLVNKNKFINLDYLTFNESVHIFPLLFNHFSSQPNYVQRKTKRKLNKYNGEINDILELIVIFLAFRKDRYDEIALLIYIITGCNLRIREALSLSFANLVSLFNEEKIEIISAKTRNKDYIKFFPVFLSEQKFREVFNREMPTSPTDSSKSILQQIKEILFRLNSVFVDNPIAIFHGSNDSYPVDVQMNRFFKKHLRTYEKEFSSVLQPFLMRKYSASDTKGECFHFLRRSSTFILNDLISKLYSNINPHSYNIIIANYLRHDNFKNLYYYMKPSLTQLNLQRQTI